MVLCGLGASSVAVGHSWDSLGRSWGGLGRSWSGLGVILGHFWRLLGVKNIDFSFVFKDFREKT